MSWPRSSVNKFLCSEIPHGILRGLNFGPGIFLGFNFGTIRSSLSLEIRSTPAGPGLEAVSQQNTVHAQQISYMIHIKSSLSAPKSRK